MVFNQIRCQTRRSLSSNIFNSVLELIFRQTNWKGKGMQIRNQNIAYLKRLTNLRFADNIVLAKNGEELKAIAEDPRRESEKVGLTINYGKTKILTNIADPGEIKMNNNKIEIVDKYKFLGQILSIRNKTEKELKVRNANAWKAF